MKTLIPVVIVFALFGVGYVVYEVLSAVAHL